MIKKLKAIANVQKIIAALVSIITLNNCAIPLYSLENAFLAPAGIVESGENIFIDKPDPLYVKIEDYRLFLEKWKTAISDAPKESATRWGWQGLRRTKEKLTAVKTLEYYLGCLERSPKAPTNAIAAKDLRVSHVTISRKIQQIDIRLQQAGMLTLNDLAWALNWQRDRQTVANMWDALTHGERLPSSMEVNEQLSILNIRADLHKRLLASLNEQRVREGLHLWQTQERVAQNNKLNNPSYVRTIVEDYRKTHAGSNPSLSYMLLHLVPGKMSRATLLRQLQALYAEPILDMDEVNIEAILASYRNFLQTRSGISIEQLLERTGGSEVTVDAVFAYYINYIQDKGIAPTYDEIKRAFHLSRATVARRLAEIDSIITKEEKLEKRSVFIEKLKQRRRLRAVEKIWEELTSEAGLPTLAAVEDKLISAGISYDSYRICMKIINERRVRIGLPKWETQEGAQKRGKQEIELDLLIANNLRLPKSKRLSYADLVAITGLSRATIARAVQIANAGLSPAGEADKTENSLLPIPAQPRIILGNNTHFEDVTMTGGGAIVIGNRVKLKKVDLVAEQHGMPKNIIIGNDVQIESLGDYRIRIGGPVTIGRPSPAHKSL